MWRPGRSGPDSGSRRALAGLLGALVLAAPPAARGLEEGVPIPFVTIAQGIQSGVHTPLQAVVRDQTEWACLWRRHADSEAPPVDFSVDMVVAVFAGTRPTAGHALEIVEAVDVAGTLRITYREHAPPPGAMVPQVLTAPFHVIRLPRSERSVHVTRAPADRS